MDSPFKPPFRLLHRTENYSPVAEVLDVNGWVVSSLLSPDKAQWLCDRLNAAPACDTGDRVLVPRKPTDKIVFAGFVADQKRGASPTPPTAAPGLTLTEEEREAIRFAHMDAAEEGIGFDRARKLLAIIARLTASPEKENGNG